MKRKIRLAFVFMAFGWSEAALANCTVTTNTVVCNPGESYDPSLHGGKPLADYDTISITTTADNSHGYAQWSDQTRYKDFTINTSGTGADGVRLMNWGPTVTFDNLDVTTTGVSADGINLGRGATDSQVTVNGTTTIKTEDGIGIRSVSSSIDGSTGPHVITLNGKSSITTKGNGSSNGGHAVYAGNNENACGFLNLFACKAVGPGEIYLLGTAQDVHSISSYGNRAHAVFSNGHAYIKAANLDIEVNGDAAHGIVAQRIASMYYQNANDVQMQDYAGSVELTGNVSVNVKGNNAYAFYVNSYSATDGKDQNGKVASIRSYDSASNQMVTDKIYRINGNMMATNSGILDLAMGNQSNFTGKTTVEKNATLNLDIRGTSSVWNMTGDSTVSNLSLTNATLAYNSTGAYSPATLTVKNDFRANNGIVYLNAVLGDDNSAADKLVVEGDTAGQGRIKINNMGGAGAQTVDGIKIIDVQGASNGVFTLNGDYTIQNQQAVVAGAYAYTLHKNGINTPNDGGWYLRSQLKGLPPQVYQAGVPTYEVYPQALLQLSRLATLQQRIGDRRWSDADTEHEPGAVRTGAWGRIEGMRSSIRPGLSDSHTNYSSNTYKAQAGMDGMLYEDVSGGRLIGGLSALYTNGRTATSSIFGDGKINSNGYGMAASLTWYGKQGFYADGQLQAHTFRSDLGSGLARGSLMTGNKAMGYTASVELGQRYDLAPGWTMTPQLQLAYSKVKFDSFTDTFNAEVALDKGESLLGRLGLSLDYAQAWRDGSGKQERLNSYALVNLYNEFMNGTRVRVGGVGVANRNERLWGGIAVGTTYSWADGKYMVYGQGMLNTSLTNFGDSYIVTGMAGFRLAF